MRIAVFTRQIGHYHHARYAALQAAGADFAVISLANEGNFDGFVSSARTEYETHRLYGGKAEYARAIADGSAQRDIDSALDAIAPDIVALAGWASGESFIALLWALEHDKPVVMMSDSQAGDAARTSWREAVKARVLGYCDAGFVAGDAHRDYLASLGIKRSRITLGYDVVDNDHFAKGAASARADAAAERQRLGLPDRPYLLASGRFVPKKNHAALIAAYASLRDTHPDAPDLVILGDGDLRGELEQQVEDLGLASKIHLPGFFAYADLPAIYGLAHGFIHAPLREQWGLVVSEAGAAGLPLAVSQTAGAAQLVKHGTNGVIFDPADPVAIKAALATLADLSPDERARWGAASTAIMQDWGPQTYATGLASAAAMAADARLRADRPRRIALPDRLLMRYLSRKIIMDVA